jgi:bla regulator protein BlaR1
MSWLEQLLPPALVRALGWTLVHSLWQGAVVALALAGLLLLLRRHRATVRYNVSAVALVVLLSLAAVTFARYYYAVRPTQTHSPVLAADSEPAPGLAGAVAIEPDTTTARAGGLQAWLTYFDQNLPVLVAAWLLGLLAMTLRLLGGLAYVQRLRHYRVQLLEEEWQQRLAALATQAGVRRPVALLESALVRVPVVVGHLRPMILLPLGTVAGLSQGYLEAILAHELAHVARRDYLLNLLQAVAETVFFYHPAVWFISACLRTERENCCDDAATALVGGNPLTLARALAALAEQSLTPRAVPRLALSAVGPDGSLLGRIRRLVQGRGTPTFSEGFMAACVVLGGLVLLSTAVALADPRPASEQSGLAGSLRRLPFLTAGDDTTRKATQTAGPPATVPETRPAPFVPKEPAVAERIEEVTAERIEEEVVERIQEVTDATPADDDKKGRRTRRVVVNEDGPRRGGPGTVVIEKDKKGRLTDLYVNGQRVEAATDSKKKGKKTSSRTEVVQMGPNGWYGPGDAEAFRFNFGHDFARSFHFDDMSRARLAPTRRPGKNGRNYTFQFRNDGGGQHDDALEQAERNLRDAERNARTDEERKRIREERERLVERRQELREAAEEARREAEQDHEDAMRDAEDAIRDAEEARHDAEEARRDAEEARHDAEESRVVREALVSELLRDKLIDDRRNYSFTLRRNAFTVNGKKQPEAMLNKYLKLYEQRTGKKMSDKGGFSINENSTGSDMYVSDMPRPPRAPRTPRAPAAPRISFTPPAPPTSLTPPTPPTPPQINTNRIREELRKDGLIGKGERSFQFQLNDSGLRVNGQQQSAELAEKYRKLFGGSSSSKGSKSTTNIQLSVSE